MKRILFVCMGNICRSPSAEGVMRQLLKANGLESVIQVDSAATHSYHIGDAPDPRACAAALRRGIDLSMLRVRKVVPEDFHAFDHILAMDRDNLAILQRGAPRELHAKIELFMRYAQRHAAEEVPDPYYGGAEGFEHVLDLLEDAAAGLLERLQAQGGLAEPWWM